MIVRLRLHQVEREWIVIRCVKTFVYLPAGYLNRAAHERPVYLSPRFEEAMWWGLASRLRRRGNLPVPMSLLRHVSRRPSSSHQLQRAYAADRNMLNPSGTAAGVRQIENTCNALHTSST